jgi:hypothetical protein
MIIEKVPVGTLAYCGRGPHLDDFTWAWTQIIQFTFEHLELFCDRERQTIYVPHGAKSGQYFTRNWLSEAMLGDWLLSIDTDHTFEPDLLYRMLRVFNDPQFPIDVMVGVYQYRGKPYNPVLYHYDADFGKYRHIIAQSTTEPLQIAQVGAGGAGHLLVRKCIFDRIRNELDEKPFNPFGIWGEDFAFFERLRMLKIPVWCAPDIQSYHLRVEETRMEDFDPRLVEILKNVQVPASPGRMMQPEPPEMSDISEI